MNILYKWLRSSILGLIFLSITGLVAAEQRSEISAAESPATKKSEQITCGTEEEPASRVLSYKTLITLAGKKERDMRYYLSPRNVAGLLEKIVLVDVRQQEIYSSYHMPGAINIQPHAIRAMKSLKQRKLVLVDEGYNFSRMEKLAVKLREAGFKETYILDGGLTSWHKAGGKITGDKIKLRKVNRLTPLAYEKQMKYNSWYPLILRKTSPENRTLINLPGSIEVDVRDKKTEAATAAIDKLISSELEQRKNIELVLISGEGLPEWYAEEIAKKINYQNIYILNGGVTAFKEHIHRREVAANNPQKYGGKKRCHLKK